MKKVDIWDLGLLYFCVVNPGLSSAYTYEFQIEGILQEIICSMSNA